MRKNVEEINNRINEVMTITENRKKMIKKDRADTVKKIADIKQKLPDISNEDDYSKLMKELEEANNHLSFLDKGAAMPKGRPFTEEEYNELRKGLINEIAEIENERAEELREAVKRAVGLMTAYFREAREVCKILGYLEYLQIGRSLSTNRYTISNVYTEDKKLMEAFCHNYFMNIEVFGNYCEKE